MKLIIYSFVFQILLFVVSFQAQANNIQITNSTLINQNTAGHYTFVQFNLSWENSWRDNNNWDAAWIFIKYKASYDSLWKHATLSTNAGDHNIPSGFTGSPSSDGKGIFIYRSEIGNGTVSLSDIRLRWNYSTDQVNDGDFVEVKVFGIEMVYVPQSSFWLGDGTTSNVRGQFSAGNSTNPFLITGEDALTLGGTSTSNLGNRNASRMYSGWADDFNSGTTKTLPAAFPKGFNAFYCMKYELSQGQYTDFLNCQTRFKQNNLTVSDISGDAVTNIYVMAFGSSNYHRTVIVCPASGNGTTQPITFTCSRPDRACWLAGWIFTAAYLDWSALRPISELEFEKACRGPLPPVMNEFAWGNTTITMATTLSTPENGTETVTNSNANCNVSLGSGNFIGGDGGNGSLRCGIFAKTNSTRTKSGATFYGIMDMSGDLLEACASVGNQEGRVFTGSHGNGILSTNGYGNNPDWPGYSGNNEIDIYYGIGYRGGHFYENNLQCRISDRFYANYRECSFYLGGRGVRTF